MGSFLRVAVNESWCLDLPVEGQGADLDLGRLELLLSDLEIREGEVEGPQPSTPAGEGSGAWIPRPC